MIIPRLALGTVQEHVRPTLVARAAMAAFQRMGVRVQSFLSQAVFQPDGFAKRVTKRDQRHLDSWLMPPAMCEAVFRHNMCGADLAIVEGSFQVPQSGSSLLTLCQWLDLPQIVVLDVSNLSPCAVYRPEFTVDGILLDNVPSRRDFVRWATTLELRWQAPVLGGVGCVPHLRRTLGNGRPGQAWLREWTTHLADAFEYLTDMDRVWQVAWRAMPRPSATLALPWTGEQCKLRVALLYDEAIQCYFPDTLDALETLGADVRMVSPLRHDNLPDGTDLVYLGCGPIDGYAARLAENCCLLSAIRGFVKDGGRVYAECGGVAYLCRQITIGEKSYPMAGILPANARRCSSSTVPSAVQLHLNANTWLGSAQDEVRGYRSYSWHLEPLGPLHDLAVETGAQGNLYSWRNVIASLMQINFAVQPHLLRRIVEPPSFAGRFPHHVST